VSGKKIILGCAILALMVGGCTTIKYSKDEVVYRKWFGRQNIKEMVVEKSTDGSVKIKLGQQSSDSGDLLKAMKAIGGIAKKAVVPVSP